jgi:APA family basic amino acid/polyamine antiporter
MNVMYLGTLPLSDIALAPQERVGVAAANEIFGHTGTYIIAALIMVSTFGCNNGLIFSGARVLNPFPYSRSNDTSMDFF